MQFATMFVRVNQFDEFPPSISASDVFSTPYVAKHEVVACLTVDRIEGNYAVLEVSSEMIDVPTVLLPPDVREGDKIEVRLVPRE